MWLIYNGVGQVVMVPEERDGARVFARYHVMMSYNSPKTRHFSFTYPRKTTFALKSICLAQKVG
jgi:hypothetical protein